MWEERNGKHLTKPGNQLLLDCWFTANRIVSSLALDNANNRKYQNMLPRLHSNMESEKKMYFILFVLSWGWSPDNYYSCFSIIFNQPRPFYVEKFASL